MRRFLASFGFWRGDSLQIASHDADVNAPKDGYSSPGVMSSFHGGSVSTSESRSSGDFWRLQLEAIYRKRNPYKLRRVPEMLENWKGDLVASERPVCSDELVTCSDLINACCQLLCLVHGRFVWPCLHLFG